MEKGKDIKDQMMRCYLWGYIIHKRNNYKIVGNDDRFNNYRDLKIYGAIEKLVEYGMSRSFANIIVVISLPMETLISLLICIKMLIVYSVKYLSTPKQSYHGRRFFPKLNYQEKRIINLFGSAGYRLEDITIIDIPGQHSKYSQMPMVSVFSGISYSQVWKSFVYSIRIILFMKKKYGKDDLLFRSYSSYPFFLCFFFISNLDESNELVFVNHYDRWMYLLGCSNLHRTYVQHGKLWRDNIKRIECDTAYYISRSQQEILEYTLFNNKPEARFRKVFDYSGLEKLKSNGCKDLLIICLSIYSEQEELIINRLTDKKINIYLKPHPNDNIDIYTRLKGKYPDIVVLGKFDYPKVDYVISYDSTLADEYEMHDIPVLKYGDCDYDRTFTKWFE